MQRQPRHTAMQRRHVLVKGEIDRGFVLYLPHDAEAIRLGQALPKLIPNPGQLAEFIVSV